MRERFSFEVGITRPYLPETASAGSDTAILACQDRGAAVAPGWVSRWLPEMVWEADPPAPPTRLDR